MSILSQIEAEISTTQRELDSLKQSQAASMDDLNKRSAEKASAMLKAKATKTAAEKSVAATTSLVQGAESDCAKVTKDGEKQLGKLESQKAAAQSKKDAADKELVDLQSEFEQKEKEILDAIAQYEQDCEKEEGEFETKLAEFKDSVAETAEKLKIKVAELEKEHSELSKSFSTVSASYKTAETELNTLTKESEAKEKELNTKQAEYTKKIKRSEEDTEFLQKELERVRSESNRKLEQLNGLDLENMLKKLTEEEKRTTTELQRFERTTAVEETELKTLTDLCDKAKTGCEQAESDAEGIKEKISAQLLELKNQADASQKEIEELQKKSAALENESWDLNAKYSAQINAEVEKNRGGKGASPAGSSNKKNKKKAAEQKPDPIQLQLDEDNKKLKEIRSLKEKEAVETKKFEERIERLEKELRQVKNGKKKIQKQGQQPTKQKKNNIWEDEPQHSSLEEAVAYAAKDKSHEFPTSVPALNTYYKTGYSISKRIPMFGESIWPSPISLKGKEHLAYVRILTSWAVVAGAAVLGSYYGSTGQFPR